VMGALVGEGMTGALVGHIFALLSHPSPHPVLVPPYHVRRQSHAVSPRLLDKFQFRLRCQIVTIVIHEILTTDSHQQRENRHEYPCRPHIQD
jgi:hypothetical protein